MSNEKYTTDHEWIRLGDDGTFIMGITDYAQEQLGDIVYIELPDIDTRFDANSEIVVIESVKAAGDVKVPVAGSIVEINSRLVDEPELANNDPMGEGWFIRISVDNKDGLNVLMDQDKYHEYIANL